MAYQLAALKAGKLVVSLVERSDDTAAETLVEKKDVLMDSLLVAQMVECVVEYWAIL
jgi:hypothetical protein